MKFSLRRALPVVLALSCPLCSYSQSYPERPIRLIAPAPAGGGVDIIGRILGQKMAENLGQQVVIDNRAGGSQIIGTDLAAKAPADGYTLLLATATHAINPSLYKKLPYDSIADFAPVSLIAESPLVFFVQPALGVNTVRDLIATAKAKPGSINYGTSGSGSGGHLGVELFNAMTGMRMVQVPYKGAGPALTALLAGEIQLLCTSPLAGRPHVQSGRLKALGVTSSRRAQAMPDLPTIADAAGLPGYEVTLWYALLAPAKTPSAIIARLNAESIKAVQSPDVIALLAAQGAEAIGNSPRELAAYLRSEAAKWSKLVREVKLQVS